MFVAAEIINRPYLFGFNPEPQCPLRNRCYRVHKLLRRRDGEQAPFARHALELVSATRLDSSPERSRGLAARLDSRRRRRPFSAAQA